MQFSVSLLESMGISSFPPRGQGYRKPPFRTAFLCLSLAPLCSPKREGARFNPPKPLTSSTFAVKTQKIWCLVKL